MKVCFLMRSEFKSVHGGDVVQINNYCNYLETNEVSCELHASFPEEPFDAYFIVNIDRPIEVYNYHKKIIKTGKPYYVIPIHHPVDAVSKFEMYSRGGFGQYLAKAIPDFYRREKVKNISRSLKRAWYVKYILKTLFLNYRKMIKGVLEQADCVFCIADKERIAMNRRFNASFEYEIVKNGIDSTYFNSTDLSERNIDVLVVGRIEQRKNQLSVIKALKGTGLVVSFAGATEDNLTQYQKAFLSECSDLKNFHYLGKLTQKELFRYYAKSKLVLNASFFEVSPLVDIEGAAMGCRVVSTKYGYTDENIEGVRLIDPYSTEEIKAACLSELKYSDASYHLNLKLLSWENTGSLILKKLSLI